MAKEYIEREKIYPIAKKVVDAIAAGNYHPGVFAYDILDWIDDLPAADVRPVVLCRDCKYSYDSVGGWCCSHGICVDCIVREDFFCADGEKRGES